MLCRLLLSCLLVSALVDAGTIHREGAAASGTSTGGDSDHQQLEFETDGEGSVPFLFPSGSSDVGQSELGNRGSFGSKRRPASSPAAAAAGSQEPFVLVPSVPHFRLPVVQLPSIVFPTTAAAGSPLNNRGSFGSPSRPAAAGGGATGHRQRPQAASAGSVPSIAANLQQQLQKAAAQIHGIHAD